MSHESLTCLFDFDLYLLISFLLQHTFIKAAKPSSILRALISDAMDIKAKRLEAAAALAEQDDDNEYDNSVRLKHLDFFALLTAVIIVSSVVLLSNSGTLGVKRCILIGANLRVLVHLD